MAIWLLLFSLPILVVIWHIDPHNVVILSHTSGVLTQQTGRLSFACKNAFLIHVKVLFNVCVYFFRCRVLKSEVHLCNNVAGNQKIASFIEHG